MYTEQINHDPALTFFQTGHQLPGRPSIGSWMSYGLGSENKNLPAFIVLVSKNASRDQPLYARLWGNGFLPSQHQGVQFRSGNDPVLFLNNPEGYDGKDRKEMLDYLGKLNNLQNEVWGDAEVDARMSQYELAFRMQTSVPDVMDTANESDEVFDLYGPDSREKGTFAANCLCALCTTVSSRMGSSWFLAARNETTMQTNRSSISSIDHGFKTKRNAR
jgi:hypothetical protein